MRKERRRFGLQSSGTAERSGFKPWIGGLVAASAIYVAGGGGSEAVAATASKTFRVSATVVASCSIQSFRQTGAAKNHVNCARAGAALAITAPKPVVTFTTGDVAGVVRETIEF